MTLEEKAEQFADNISGLERTCSLLAAKDKDHAYRLGRYDGYIASAKENQQVIEQAKAIIKEMLPYMPKENIEGIYEIVESAEQFLKEYAK